MCIFTISKNKCTYFKNISTTPQKFDIDTKNCHFQKSHLSKPSLYMWNKIYKYDKYRMRKCVKWCTIPWLHHQSWGKPFGSWNSTRIACLLPTYGKRIPHPNSGTWRIPCFHGGSTSPGCRQCRGKAAWFALPPSDYLRNSVWPVLPWAGIFFCFWTPPRTWVFRW